MTAETKRHIENTKCLIGMIIMAAALCFACVRLVRECTPGKDSLPETGLTPEEYNMTISNLDRINLTPMDWDEWLEAICDIYNIDPCIVAAIIERESGGDPNAVNPATGAAGLMQITPSTWEAQVTAMRLEFALYPDELQMDPLDPIDNARVGVWLLHDLSEKYPDALPYVLDCYALGEGGAEERLLRMRDYEPTAWTKAVLDRATDMIMERAELTPDSIFTDDGELLHNKD